MERNKLRKKKKQKNLTTRSALVRVGQSETLRAYPFRNTKRKSLMIFLGARQLATYNLIVYRMYSMKPCSIALIVS